MDPVLLVRPDFMTKYELRHAQDHFPVVYNRTACRSTVVIGRYSVLPFYHEVENDLKVNQCQLINSAQQHRWIANFEYFQKLRKFTPETWTDENIHRCQHPGPFVVKGTLTSKKRQWNRHMFAATKKRALAIAKELREDTWIGDQEMIYRRYVPLRTFGYGKNGLPFTNEWRFFYFRDQRLSYGYYWSISNCVGQAEITPPAIRFADHLAGMVAQHTNFFALDIAETEDGQWILIEINEGQMANLCENDPAEFYGNLRNAIVRCNLTQPFATPLN